MKLTIQDIASIVQIGFFITGSTVAVLTYKSARRGLLNTVNTEYQKRVMDNLADLSKRLYEFTDFDSDSSWLSSSEKRGEYYKELVENYKNKLMMNKGIPDYISELHLRKIVDDIKSEPFIPIEIIHIVKEGIGKKEKKIDRILFEEIRLFIDELYNGDYDHCLEYAGGLLNNRIVEKLYEEDCGIEHLENDIHEIREYIRGYLLKFNPFYKKENLSLMNSGLVRLLNSYNKIKSNRLSK